MNYITRPADDFRKGDRVIHVPTEQVFRVDAVYEDGVYRNASTFFRKEDLLRFVEVGEVLPKGSVTKYFESGGLSEPQLEINDFEVMAGDALHVLISLPETPEEKTRRRAKETLESHGIPYGKINPDLRKETILREELENARMSINNILAYWDENE